MAADGQVVFEITADGKKAVANIKDITKAIEAEGKKWDQSAKQSTSGIENAFASMAKKVAGYLSAAAIGKKLLDIGKDAIDAASDLAEVQNVVDTVFGESANTIEAWSKKAGQQFGLTETQAKKFTSTLGAMMKSSGIAGNEITKMSTDLAGLAADMASFYNLDFETAFEKIRSGISGETMPLKQLGINMSVANLEAFALAQGLEKTFSQMSQGEQTMLRYQYLMQATADAQGDFAKTSDGFANAQRRIQTSIESIQTSLGKILLPTVEKVTGAVASFLSGIASGMMPEKTVLDEFNDAKVDADEKLAKIQQTYDSASDLIKILRDIENETVKLSDGSTVTLGNLFADLGSIEKNGGDIKQYIESLGLNVDDIVLKYNEWKEATRQLTSLVPSLTAQINSETGAINGGTDALQKNLDEWKKNEENKVYWAEYFAKAEAVARAKGEQAGLEITAKARQLAVQREAQKLAEQYGTTFSDGKIWDRFTGEAKVKYESGEFNFSEVEDQFENYNRMVDEADKAQKKADQSANDLADAQGLLADELQATQAMTGQTITQQQGLAETSNYLGKSTQEWIDALKNSPKAAEAVKAMTDYYKGVRDATEQTVKSTIKGFSEVTTKYDELIKKREKVAEESGAAEVKYMSEVNSLRKKFGDDWMKRLQVLGEESKEWKDLSESERKAYNELVKLKNAQKEVNDALNDYSPQKLQENLQSQITFMQEYVKNLNQLREWGVSDEMIAALSDGTTESAALLQGIVKGGKEEAEKLSGLYAEVGKEKKTFVDTLTENKLAADQTFKDLVATVEETMGSLDFSQKGFQLMSDSVLGVARGISSKVPEVSAAVDNLIEALSPLSSLGFSWGYSGGSFKIDFSSLFGGVQHFAGGTDWIPRNNYPAFLDYGEAVLTAEENQIWQRFKNGMQPTSMDYDALGGVMRDNVKAGGDVYLEGRVVGQVISDAQGRSYRNLQRSGWQG